jgi:hypothetical protein
MHQSEQRLHQITGTGSRGIRGAAHQEEPSMVEEDGGGQPDVAGEDFCLRMTRTLGEEETCAASMVHGRRKQREKVAVDDCYGAYARAVDDGDRDEERRPWHCLG